MNFRENWLEAKMQRVSYSQSGQDMLIRYFLSKYRIIPKHENYVGCYVDIGCNDPKFDSNTYFFYERGWSGVCVDANPVMIEKFQIERPRDKAIACGIGREEGVKDFFVSKRPQSSSFSGQTPERLEKIIPVRIRPISSILDDYNIKSIDFMSIDVEGMERQVILSLDFQRHKPQLVIVEAKISMEKILNSPNVLLMNEYGYKLICHTGHDAYFIAPGCVGNL